MSDYLNDIMALSSTITPTEDDEQIIYVNGITRDFTFPINYNKIVANKLDENSNLLTFCCTEYVDGVDLLECSLKVIKWENKKAGTSGFYRIEDSEISIKGPDLCFKWLIDEKVTTEAGPLWFSICFMNIDEIYSDDVNYEKYATYKWQTDVCKELTIGESIYVSQLDGKIEYINYIENYEYSYDTEENKIGSVIKEGQKFWFNVQPNTNIQLYNQRTHKEEDGTFSNIDERFSPLPEKLFLLTPGQYTINISGIDNKIIDYAQITFGCLYNITETIFQGQWNFAQDGSYNFEIPNIEYAIDTVILQITLFCHNAEEASSNVHITIEGEGFYSDSIDWDTIEIQESKDFINDEPDLELNSITRELNFVKPQEYYNKNLANNYDHLSNLITIKIDKYIDGYDITKNDYLGIKWKNFKGNSGYSLATYKVSTEDTNKLILSWLPPIQLTNYSGPIQIALCFLTVSKENNYEKIIYKWQSNICNYFSVGEGIFIKGIDDFPYFNSNTSDLIVDYEELREMIKQKEVYGIDIGEYQGGAI